MAGAPQTTQSARESNIRHVIDELEWYDESLSIQLEDIKWLGFFNGKMIAFSS